MRRDELAFDSRRSGVLAAARCAGARSARLAGRSRCDTTRAAAALAEIRLGIPAITPAVAERFVAQMLNLDELGAVSFDKGCYPGQEVIARVHNLGGVKRRARRYAAPAAPPAPGAPVLAADAQVGEVVAQRRGASRAASCSPSSSSARPARR